ncbi:RDD family protein [Singulisphaera acidiphila]|uniref:Putative membrane protein/domain protein n=1 Tax=Singulisphaera acidiphila (strain ATCC BAA-1392 / DSM 18658 / VKM B-2454 / MOB10) TaxID=886293 RepID=L0DPB1_SINAD|nr:RDD family protein [Singulisphaera acidiphila]AGA30511.1 putative membrane protein/domain protein [Singulisphaera acidiphila DSM 18658]
MATASLKRSDDPLDTTVRLVTPERIVFQYPLAGPFRRYFAYLIDFAIVLAAVVIASLTLIVLSLGSQSGVGPIFVAYFVIMWGYRGFCEAVFNGQTLGKRALGLRVVSERGVPITGAQAVLRNLVGSLDGTVPYLIRPDLTSLLLLTGLTSMLLTRKFQRLGDLAAGTMVVVEQRRGRAGLIRVEEPAVVALLPWLPLRVEAGPELARALSDYVNHRARLPRARREEMALHLARPLSVRYRLPENVPADVVVCAFYHRVFVGE